MIEVVVKYSQPLSNKHSVSFAQLTTKFIFLPVVFAGSCLSALRGGGACWGKRELQCGENGRGEYLCAFTSTVRSFEGVVILWTPCSSSFSSVKFFLLKLCISSIQDGWREREIVLCAGSPQPHHTFQQSCRITPEKPG
jgi:hypothetical protein